MKWQSILSHVRWSGLDPDDLDRYEPLPYIRRLVQQKYDAGFSGFFIGLFITTFFGTVAANHIVEKNWFIAAHGAGMLVMGTALAGYLIVNMHRLNWLPVAFVGIVALALAERL